MRSLLFLIFGTLAVSAQVTGWKVEPGSPQRAATIERRIDETLSYGFSCWKKNWVFFFNLQAPQGGLCEDHEACERDVSEVALTFDIEGRPATTDKFTLFENYYFQAGVLQTKDMAAIVKAGRFRLGLDNKLQAIWQKEAIEFGLEGFESAVKENAKAFSCLLHETAPIPQLRPSDKELKAQGKPALAKKLPSKIKMIKQKTKTPKPKARRKRR